MLGLRSFFLLLALFLSGCVGDVYVDSTTIVTTRPSYAQEVFPRGENVVACSTMAGLYDYLDNYTSGYPNGCGQVEMTAVTSRGEYYSYRFGRVSIYQFQHGHYKYFTFTRGGYSSYHRRHY